jgi:hypothetical protein
MKDTSIGVDEETAIDARYCSAKTHESQSELARRYFKALRKLLQDLPESARVSITDFEIDLKTSTIRQQCAPIFTLTELPYEIQKEVESAFGYKRGEHGELIDTTEKVKEA